MELMAPLEHRAMLRNQRIRPLLQMKLGAFLDPHLGPLRGAAKGGEHRHVGIEPHAIIAPMPGRDHPPVKIEDALQLGAVECGNGTPVPRMRKRRDDAQALLTFGLGWRARAELGHFAAQRLDLLLQLGQPRPRRIAILAAGRAIGHEAGAVVDGVDRHRPGRDADHRRVRVRHPW